MHQFNKDQANNLTVRIFLSDVPQTNRCCLSCREQRVGSGNKELVQLLHKILMLVFKSLFVSTYPGYLKELFVFRNCSYSLRGKNILTLPIPRTTNYGLECIGYQAAKIWNSLPDSMRTMTSFKDFKKAVKKRAFKFYSQF